MKVTEEWTNHRLLTIDEEQELARRIGQGDLDARNTIVECNLRLVMKIAHGYKGNGVPLEDLVSVGSIGLMKAADRFVAGKLSKDGKTVRFSTYAQFYVKHEMKKLLSQMAGVSSVSTSVYSRHKNVREIAGKLGDGWTEEDMVSNGSGIKKGKNINSILCNSNRAVSFSDRIDGDGTRTYGDVIEDEHQSDVQAQIAHDECLDMMMGEFENLTEQEQVVLRMSYGMDGEGERKLREIADKFGLSKERIRQIRESALGKLKNALMQQL